MIKGIYSIVCVALSLQTLAQENKTQNLIIITLDGFRWQEIFEGADPEIIFENQFVADVDVRKKFWSPLPSDRRERLMPFLWQTIGKQGQLYGNRKFSNRVDCANPHWFSYPGYSEILLGFVDWRVRSNKPINNPNRTVLDFIQSQQGFANRVATFATWGMIENMACENRAEGTISERGELLNELQQFFPNSHGARHDAFTFFYAFEYLKRSCPRVMLISFDETDEHAHGGRYDDYLKAAHRTDAMIGKLWKWVQSQKDYKDKTTMIITTDHGRGSRSKHSWRNHGRMSLGSNQVWLAVVGPDTPALGEMKINVQYYQKQIAKTAAAFLGLDYSNEKSVGHSIESMMSIPSGKKNTIFVYEE